MIFRCGSAPLYPVDLPSNWLRSAREQVPQVERRDSYGEIDESRQHPCLAEPEQLDEHPRGQCRADHCADNVGKVEEAEAGRLRRANTLDKAHHKRKCSAHQHTPRQYRYGEVRCRY